MSFLRDSCTPESDCEGAQIVFGELVANVVRHAPGPIEVTVQANSEGSVMLDVCDTGAGFALSPCLPESFHESGRGLYISSQICIFLSATQFPGGNKVSAVLPVKALPSPLHLLPDTPRQSTADPERRYGDAERRRGRL